jgi:hypothetical protein
MAVHPELHAAQRLILFLRHSFGKIKTGAAVIYIGKRQRADIPFACLFHQRFYRHGAVAETVICACRIKHFFNIISLHYHYTPLPLYYSIIYHATISGTHCHGTYQSHHLMQYSAGIIQTTGSCTCRQTANNFNSFSHSGQIIIAGHSPFLPYQQLHSIASHLNSNIYRPYNRFLPNRFFSWSTVR